MKRRMLKSCGFLMIIFSAALVISFLPTQVLACYYEEDGCRVTGGGNDTDCVNFYGCFNGTLASDKLRLGAGQYDRYTFGGQAGANTALPPQPKGEWTHHQQAGFHGDFVFHAGTASAPPGTEIATIICSDPSGPCSPAGLSPYKQIDFDGVGTFKNIKDPTLSFPEKNATHGVTYHYFQVHIEDLGEPGRQGNKNSGGNCPAYGRSDAFALYFNEPADCQCADFYRIRIFNGVTPIFDSNGILINLEEMKGQSIIYEVYGYIDGGNLQIHPPTGYDQ